MKRSFLTALGLEKAIIDQILDENGADLELAKEKHGETLTAEKVKLQRKIDELQGVIDNTPAASADGKDWKSEHDKIKGEFDIYKQTVETEKQVTITTTAIRKHLEADGANPKLVDLLLKAIDPSAAKIKDGSIENWAELSRPIKEQYSDVFGEVRQTGADVGTPPAANGTLNPFSKEHFDLQAQTALFRENPKLARQMAGAAGIKLLD